MDKADFKAKEFKSWTAVVPGWKKHDESLRNNAKAVTARMLDLAQINVGSSVLDIACGTGEPAIPAAQRVGPSGKVMATDWVADMVAFARSKAAALGLTHIEFRVIDGEAIDVAPASVDAVTIRWGLMFMPNPDDCISRAYQALKPGGRIVISNWAGPDKTPWASVALGVIKKHVDIPAPPPGATGLYSFADPARNLALLMNAGFQSVTIEELNVPVIDVDNGADYFTWVKEMAGPIASLYSSLAPEIQMKVDRDAAADAQAKSEVRERVRLSGMTWITAGTKS
jgi:ubiquinone/menaquinone biosynthesis C-methylase UbiE